MTGLAPPRPFLERMPAPDRDALLALGITRPVRPGTHLMVEGARDTHVEIIRKGYVKVTRSTGGVPRLMGVRLPGDIVGEFAAVTGSGRQATVTTCDEVVATVLRQADFLRFLAAHPQVANLVTATVGERLQWANDRRSEFAAYPVHVRLAHVLSDIALGCGQQAGGGVLIGVRLNQTELAALVGAAEDTVQKALRELRRRELIRTGYRRITVLDVDGLRKLSGDE